MNTKKVVAGVAAAVTAPIWGPVAIAGIAAVGSAIATGVGAVAGAAGAVGSAVGGVAVAGAGAVVNAVTSNAGDIADRVTDAAGDILDSYADGTLIDKGQDLALDALHTQQGHYMAHRGIEEVVSVVEKAVKPTSDDMKFNNIYG